MVEVGGSSPLASTTTKNTPSWCVFSFAWQERYEETPLYRRGALGARTYILDFCANLSSDDTLAYAKPCVHHNENTPLWCVFSFVWQERYEETPLYRRGALGAKNYTSHKYTSLKTQKTTRKTPKNAVFDENIIMCNIGIISHILLWFPRALQQNKSRHINPTLNVIVLSINGYSL